MIFEDGNRNNFVQFLGNNFGKASDIETQTRILRRGLAMIHEVTVPGVLEDWPEEWHEPVEYFTGKKKSS